MWALKLPLAKISQERKRLIRITLWFEIYFIHTRISQNRFIKKIHPEIFLSHYIYIYIYDLLKMVWTIIIMFKCKYLCFFFLINVDYREYGSIPLRWVIFQTWLSSSITVTWREISYGLLCLHDKNQNIKLKRKTIQRN